MRPPLPQPHGGQKKASGRCKKRKAASLVTDNGTSVTYDGKWSKTAAAAVLTTPPLQPTWAAPPPEMIPELLLMLSKDNASGYRGVRQKNNSCFTVHCGATGCTNTAWPCGRIHELNLGRFKDKITAARAYYVHQRDHHPNAYVPSNDMIQPVLNQRRHDKEAEEARKEAEQEALFRKAAARAKGDETARRGPVRRAAEASGKEAEKWRARLDKFQRIISTSQQPGEVDNARRLATEARQRLAAIAGL
jgi:hypothetical protein